MLKYFQQKQQEPCIFIVKSNYLNNTSMTPIFGEHVSGKMRVNIVYVLAYGSGIYYYMHLNIETESYSSCGDQDGTTLTFGADKHEDKLYFLSEVI